MTAYEGGDTIAVGPDWDFAVYPNPTSDAVTLALPIDNVPRDIVVFDMAGRRAFSRLNVSSHVLGISTAGLDKGAYCVRVSDGANHRMKILVIQ